MSSVLFLVFFFFFFFKQKTAYEMRISDWSSDVCSSDLQKVPTLDRDRYESADGLRKGAYVLLDADGGKPDVIVIGTGAETGLALAAVEKLQGEGIAARAVSMPCWELYDQQPRAYREYVLTSYVPSRLWGGAGPPPGWHRQVGDRGETPAG